jgi:hypothetical protein
MINGTGRIADVTGKFKKMLDQVRLGMEELTNSKASNLTEIDRLTAQNAVIDAEYDNAAKLKVALERFIPGGE